MLDAGSEPTSTRCAPPPTDIGKAFRIDDARGRYVVFLKTIFPQRADARRAQGRRRLRPRRRLQGRAGGVRGAGRQGHRARRRARRQEHQRPAAARSTRRRWRRRSGATRRHLGIALDGDADRVIVATRRGGSSTATPSWRIVRPRHAGRAGALRKKTVVATVMSQHRPRARARRRRRQGGAHAVGDRYVVEEMRRSGYNFGGEQSGHLIFLDHVTTGDGVAAGAQGARGDARGRDSRSRSWPRCFEPVPAGAGQHRGDAEAARSRSCPTVAARHRARSERALGARGAGPGALLRHRAQGAGAGRGADDAGSGHRRGACASAGSPGADLGAPAFGGARSAHAARLDAARPSMPARLGVNIDHVATLRQARRHALPGPGRRRRPGRARRRRPDHHPPARGPPAHPGPRPRMLRKTVTTRLNLEMAATQEMVQHRLRGEAGHGHPGAGAARGADHRGRPGRGGRPRGASARWSRPCATPDRGLALHRSRPRPGEGGPPGRGRTSSSSTPAATATRGWRPTARRSSARLVDAGKAAREAGARASPPATGSTTRTCGRSRPSPRSRSSTSATPSSPARCWSGSSARCAR